MKICNEYPDALLTVENITNGKPLIIFILAYAKFLLKNNFIKQ